MAQVVIRSYVQARVDGRRIAGMLGWFESIHGSLTIVSLLFLLPLANLWTVEAIIRSCGFLERVVAGLGAVSLACLSKSGNNSFNALFCLQ